MPILLVTYDLNEEGAAYSATRKKVVDYIEDHDWARLSESSYAIDTTETPKQVYEALVPHLDDNDDLLVFTLTTPYWGQADDEVVEWLEGKMSGASRRGRPGF